MSADKFFLNEVQFVAGVANHAAMISEAGPEVAFAGRSNVGKSSLINALTGRKLLARVSQTPGATQQLNFYDMAGAFLLVDMPGYGFAKVAKKTARDWNHLFKDYLRGRRSLRLCCVLVDARHGLKDSDRDMLRLLDEAAVPARIVLTKADQITQAQANTLVQSLAPALKKHPACHPDPVVTSSDTKQGIDVLRQVIADTLDLTN